MELISLIFIICLGLFLLYLIKKIPMDINNSKIKDNGMLINSNGKLLISSKKRFCFSNYNGVLIPPSDDDGIYIDKNGNSFITGNNLFFIKNRLSYLAEIKKYFSNPKLFKIEIIRQFCKCREEKTKTVIVILIFIIIVGILSFTYSFYFISFSLVPLIGIGIHTGAISPDVSYVDDFVAGTGNTTSVEVQSAVNDAVSNGNGVIYVPAGVFTFTGTNGVVIPENQDGVTIIGNSTGKTIFRSTMTGGTNVIEFAYTAAVTTDIVMSDIYIEGGGSDGYGLYLDHPQRIDILRVRIEDMGSGGVYILNSYNGGFSKMFLRSNKAYGLRFKNCNDLEVVNCHVRTSIVDGAPTGNGYHLSDSVDIRFWGGSAEDNGRAGVFLSRGCERNTIFNVYIEGNTLYGVELNDTSGTNAPDGNKIKECYFNGIKGIPTTPYGISIENGKYNEIGPCTFRNHTNASIILSDSGGVTEENTIYENITEDSTYVDVNHVNSLHTIIRDKRNISLISDSGTYTIWPDMEYEIMQNNSGGALAIGDVVVIDHLNNNSITVTNEEDSPRAYGMVYQATIANGSYGFILTKGSLQSSLLKVNGTIDISIGDYLKTYPSNGIAMKGTNVSECFAIAMEAYTNNDSNGTIEVILLGHIQKGESVKDISFPFVSDGGTTTTESTRGYSVNGASEAATTFFEYPSSWQKIVKITVRAVANGAETDGMLCDFYLQAGSSNEAYNTHTITWLSEISDTTNYAANDIVEWTLTDNALAQLQPGDSINFWALYRATDGTNEATNCRFRSILVEYL